MWAYFGVFCFLVIQVLFLVWQYSLGNFEIAACFAVIWSIQWGMALPTIVSVFIDDIRG